MAQNTPPSPTIGADEGTDCAVVRTGRKITPNTPLRLRRAAQLAFPDGSMKLAGLRREIARGRLSYEVIANKHYTTLADIDEMRKLCRVQAKGPNSVYVKLGIATEKFTSVRPGLSATDAPKSPQDVLRMRVRNGLPKKHSAP